MSMVNVRAGGTNRDGTSCENEPNVDHGGNQEGGGAAYRQQWVACLMPVREISML